MRSLDPAWFEWTANLLAELPAEIREKHGREPDTGDLLIVLAFASDTVANEVLGQLGLAVDRLGNSLEQARRGHAVTDLDARIEKIRQRKEAALESEDLELADRLRDEERSLIRKLTSDRAAVAEEIRARLGLVDRDVHDD